MIVRSRPAAMAAPLAVLLCPLRVWLALLAPTSVNKVSDYIFRQELPENVV